MVAGRSWTHVSLTGETVYSGTFTVSFDAFEPFGFLKYKSYDTTDTDGASAYCGILPQSMMPAAPTTSSRQFQVYNCGTEDADTIITLAGSAPNGMTITNLTNGNVCTIPSLPESGTLTLDSRQGLVSDINGPAFEYHNDGFIRLAPYYPDIQNLKVSYSSSSTTLTVVDTTADKSWIGKFVRIGNEWIKISFVSDQGVVTLSKTPAASGTNVITRLAVLNDITISGDELTLSTFTFDYTPVLSV